MRAIRKLLKVCIGALLCAALAANLWTIYSGMVLKQSPAKCLGFSKVVVMSGSMEPVYMPGDLLIIHEQKEYQPGDVITFRAGGSLVTHRIREIIEDQGYVTKGDANNTADREPVPFDAAQGKVVAALPGAGSMILRLQGPSGVILLCAVILVWYKMAVRKRKEGDPA